MTGLVYGGWKVKDQGHTLIQVYVGEDIHVGAVASKFMF